jgi:hypothetical protein
MKKISLIVAAVTMAFPGFLVSAKADIIADWTFEGTPLSLINPSSDFIYGPADSGTGLEASGHHSSASTTWSFPGGAAPSAPTSFAADHWNNVGTLSPTDYWQFSISTVGFQNINVSFDTAGNADGPATFQLQYSTTGTLGTFTNFGPAYTVTTSFVNKPFDLTSVAGLNNDANAVFRLVDVSPAMGGAINNGNGTTSGTNQIDNFVVTGAPTVPVPEPATVLGGALALGGLVFHQRRRVVGLLRSNAA